MNDLQKINATTSKQLKKLAAQEREKVLNWYALELEEGRGINPYTLADFDGFDIESWREVTKFVTTDGMIKGTGVGLGGSYSVANVSSTSRYFLGLTVEGVSLSETLRDSAKDANRLTQQAINTHLENKTTWKRLSNDLTSKRVSKGDLPKYLKELEKASIDAGGNTRELRKAMKEAKRNIEKLAQNGSPTRELKKAYEGVVSAVEKGDKKALDIALRRAIDQKARYNNDRIARTELTRAYSKGYKRQLLDDPDYKDGNAYVRVVLSPDHNVVDVCDFVTEVDSSNLGGGVYRVDDAPLLPLHVNCLCEYETVVIRDIDKRSIRFSEKRAEEKLQTMDSRVIKSTENTTLRSLTALPAEYVE